MSNVDGKDLATTQRVVRNCYLLILFNSIWLLIPFIGLITGNNLNIILSALVIAGAALFLSNNYIGKKWYYFSGGAKNTIYESHLANIDHIGFIVFFVTLISGLTFLIAAVFITNIFKSQFGAIMLLIANLAIGLLLIALAFWVLKHAAGGMIEAGKSRAYKYEKIANIF